MTARKIGGSAHKRLIRAIEVSNMDVSEPLKQAMAIVNGVAWRDGAPVVSAETLAKLSACIGSGAVALGQMRAEIVELKELVKTAEPA